MYLEVSTAALMLWQALQGFPPGRRLGTHPVQPSHFSTVSFFFAGTRRNRRQLGPGASESVENPDTSSSVPRHSSSSSCSSFLRKTESEPSDLQQRPRSKIIRANAIKRSGLIMTLRSLVPGDRRCPWKPMGPVCRLRSLRSALRSRKDLLRLCTGKAPGSVGLPVATS